MSFEYQYTIEDPAYGSRIFRRRIRIETRGDTIVAGLEDFMHALKIELWLDGITIAAIDGTWYRHPNLSCQGATAQLSAFVGKPITGDRIVYRDYASVRQQCTHFHDLLGLAMRHALRGGQMRQYDVSLPDMVNGRTVAEVHLDGITMLCWEIDRESILSPAALSGRPLEKGFTRWASETFTGDELEAAQVLQMGIFVSRACHIDFTAMGAKYPGVVLSPPQLAGACHALQPERMHAALPCHDIRDFTHTADQMLRFM